MPKIVPIEKFQKSTFFVLVTGVFWRRRFVCGGQRYENAKSSDQNNESEEDENPWINFVAVGQLRLHSQQQHSFLQGLRLAKATAML